MPLFFIVGGFSNAASWESARGRGDSYAAWLTARSTRLLRPAVWFVAFWALIPTLGVLIGLLPSSIARVGGQEVALPLWFLGVYLLAVPAIPPLLWAHRRLGPLVLLPLGLGALVVDMLRFGLDLTAVGAVNFAFVWAAIIELGFLWRDGSLRRRAWLAWTMIGGASSRW